MPMCVLDYAFMDSLIEHNILQKFIYDVLSFQAFLRRDHFTTFTSHGTPGSP